MRNFLQSQNVKKKKDPNEALRVDPKNFTPIQRHRLASKCETRAKKLFDRGKFAVAAEFFTRASINYASTGYVPEYERCLKALGDCTEKIKAELGR